VARVFEPGKNGIDRWRCAKLWLRIQLDAFRLDPLGYLQAVAWRARGFRLRSRNRIAALAGKSPAAYSFWISCREPRLMSFDHAPKGLLANALAVIDCRDGTKRIEGTLASLPDEMRPILLQGSYRNAARIDTIGDLGNFFETDEVWICPLNAGDRLADHACSAYREAIAAHPEQQIIYADDDLLEVHEIRVDPHFKPDWNPELFHHHDFVTGAAMLKVKRDDLASVASGGWAEGLVRRVLDRSPAPLHLPFILHHRRTRPEPILPARASPMTGTQLPRVSVIIPTRNRAELLRKCLEGLSRTDYPNPEIIVVDNDSDEPEALAYFQQLRNEGIAVIRIEGDFNYSALNNAAVRAARGEFLCFLNNDIEIIEPDWLQWLVSRAARPDIGAAGARLLYPDGTLQHAGVFIGIGGGAAHAHRFLKADERGYFDRSRLPQRVSAVTGACLVVSREKFSAVGGFDEKNFRVAFNDIDLCLKLNRRGWQSFYEPRATLFHHESKSRGSDKTKENRARFADELSALKRIWHTDEQRDPFHHPQLSPFCEQFVIAV
jgi:GT2 family glycosyltransferase